MFSTRGLPPMKKRVRRRKLPALEAMTKKRGNFRNDRLRAWAFSTTNSDHLQQLKTMGIEVQVDSEGRVMLIHRANAVSFKLPVFDSPICPLSLLEAHCNPLKFASFKIFHSIGVQKFILFWINFQIDGGPPVACLLEPDDPTSTALHKLSQRFFYQIWNTSNQAALTAATVILLMFCLWVVLLFASIILVGVASVCFKLFKLGPFKNASMRAIEISVDDAVTPNTDDPSSSPASPSPDADVASPISNLRSRIRKDD